MINLTIGELVKNYGGKAHCVQQADGTWQVGVVQQDTGEMFFVKAGAVPRAFATLSRAVNYMTGREACTTFDVRGHAGAPAVIPTPAGETDPEGGPETGAELPDAPDPDDEAAGDDGLPF